MFFFFYEKSIDIDWVIKRAFERIIAKKIVADNYCDLREFIHPKRKKEDIKLMLSQINSPFVELFNHAYPSITKAADIWSEYKKDRLTNDMVLKYEEAWSIVYWIYRCYGKIDERKKATKEALNEIEEIYQICKNGSIYEKNSGVKLEKSNKEGKFEKLKFCDSYIYNEEKVHINTIRSVTEYCKKLKNITEEKNLVFFRGHADTTYRLLPSIMRCDEWYKHERDIYNEVIIECPEEFRECSTHLEHLVLMQHYGVPTRLLDITKNPLVALYFACGSHNEKNGEIIVFSTPKSEIKYAKSDTVSVLASLANFAEDEKNVFEETAKKAMSRENFNEKIKRLIHEIRLEKPAFLSEVEKSDITNAFFVLPEKKNRRIVKQDGAFIIYGLINENNDVINKYRYKEKNKIQIFIVKSGKKEEILKELDALSINKATLFPEIEDVAEYIKKKY